VRRTAKPSILIVDDHELLAQTLALALRGRGHEADVVVVESVDTIVKEVRARKPELVLLDLELGKELGPSTPLIPALRETGAVVLVLTGITDRTALAETLEAGAVGVVAKSQAFDEVVEVIGRVLAGQAAMRAGERENLLGALRASRSADEARLAPFRALTDREAAVLAGLLVGKTAEQVAEESFVAVTTVRSQIRSLLRKLGVNSQLQAVALARDAGWVPRSSS